MNNRRKNISKKHSIVNQVARQTRKPKERSYSIKRREVIMALPLFKIP